MTTKEFWEVFTNTPILDTFDETVAFFSQELPPEALTQYDLETVVLETHAQNQDAKRFDKVVCFSELIREKQPALHQDLFPYLHDFLVEYYAYQQDADKVTEAIQPFIDKPIQGYDQYLPSLKQVLFYQHTELLDQAISSTYPIVSTSKALVPGAETSLALAKYYLCLQEMWEDHPKGFDPSAFSTMLRPYNFSFQTEHLKAVAQGLWEKPLAVKGLEDRLGTEDGDLAVTTVQGYFLRYMHERGVAFYLSGKIWDTLNRYWKKHNEHAISFGTYFEVEKRTLDEFLVRMTSQGFMPNYAEVIATLWGSVHVYEFLASHGFISEEHFQEILKTLQTLKGKVIGQFTSILWSANFVHTWPKPDSISEVEFAQEHAIFRKSLTIPRNKFSVLRREIADELGQIGPLSSAIIEGGKIKKGQQGTLVDKAHHLEVDGTSFDRMLAKSEPKKAEPKVNRNDPCPCGSGKKYKKCCG